MTTKSGARRTAHIGRRAAENVLHAIRFAGETGRPFNTHITINFTSLGLSGEQAASAFQEIRDSLSRWWRYERDIKHRDIGHFSFIYSHANPAGSRHVHCLAHVPSGFEPEFRRAVAKRVIKATRRSDLADGLLIGPIAFVGGLAKYILRGIDPYYAAYLHIVPANEGLVEGCYRTGVSRCVGKQARISAGWKRRRNGRRPTR